MNYQFKRNYDEELQRLNEQEKTVLLDAENKYLVALNDIESRYKPAIQVALSKFLGGRSDEYKHLLDSQVREKANATVWKENEVLKIKKRYNEARATLVAEQRIETEASKIRDDTMFADLEAGQSTISDAEIENDLENRYKNWKEHKSE